MNYMLATCHQELYAVLSSLHFLIHCFLFNPHLLSDKHTLGMVLSPQLEWHVSARPPPIPNTHSFGCLHAFSNQSAPRFASLTAVARTLHSLTLLSFKHPILDQHPMFYYLTPFSQGTHSTEGFWNKSPVTLFLRSPTQVMKQCSFSWLQGAASSKWLFHVFLTLQLLVQLQPLPQCSKPSEANAGLDR